MLSRYSTVASLPNGKILIYNTMHQKAVVLETDLFEAVRNGHGDADTLAKYAREVQALLDMGIMIQSESQDDDLLKAWYESLKNNSKLLSLTILTSYECNIDCSYCFEGDRKKKQDLTLDTSQSIINWVSSAMDEVLPETLKIKFFGGEPLVNIGSLMLISGTLADMARKRGIKTDFGVITNGVLLSVNVAECLRSSGVNYVKVTLDGVKESHDRLRHSKNNKGTFDIILRNLKAIRGILRIVIGCNFNQESFKDALALPEFLNDEGFKSYVDTIIFKPIKDHLKIATMSDQHCHGGGYTPEEVELMWQLREELIRCGYQVKKEFSLGPCEYHHKLSYTIDVHGDIYPCGGFPGIREFVMGNVRNTSLDALIPKMDNDVPGGCQSCGFFNSCGGGCRYLSFLRECDTAKETCEMPYFETIAPRVLLQNYQSTQTGKGR